MVVKHTTSIFLSKFNLVYKIIIYFAIVALVISAITFAIISPAINDIKAAVTETGVIGNFKIAITHLLKGDDAFIEDFSVAYASLVLLKDVFIATRGEIIFFVVTLVVALFVLMFFMALSFLPFSDILQNYMSSKSDYGFLSNSVANRGKSALYALIYTFTVFLISLAIVFFGAWFISKALPKFGFFALPLVYLVVVILLSLRSAFVAGWLPAVVCENCGVFKGFSRGFKAMAPHFIGVFGAFFFMNILTFAVTMFLGVFSLGLGFIIAIPSAFIIYRILELVLYYNAKNYNYYIDNDTVIKTSFFK